ncbi:hypothetical protein AB1Y20_001884 [Prymnesium parvum]|uniref:Hexosyltransferase n=1 Tax=Prymnesium parvum TaxID=97485 RepID=A0AB34J9X0_PRYPA
MFPALLGHVYYISCDESTERRAQLLADLNSHGLRTLTRVPCVRARSPRGSLSSEALLSIIRSSHCQQLIEARHAEDCSPANPSCCLDPFWHHPDGSPCEHWNAYDDGMRALTADRTNHQPSRFPLLFLHLKEHLEADVRAGTLGDHMQRSNAACWNSIGSSLSFLNALRLVAANHAAPRAPMAAGFVLLLEDDARLQPGWRNEMRALLRRHPPSTWHIAKLTGGGFLLQQPPEEGFPKASWAGTVVHRLVTLVPPTIWGTAAILLHSDNASFVLKLLEEGLIGNHDIMMSALFAQGKLKLVQSQAPILYPNCSVATTIGVE